MVELHCQILAPHLLMEQLIIAIGIMLSVLIVNGMAEFPDQTMRKKMWFVCGSKQTQLFPILRQLKYSIIVMQLVQITHIISKTRKSLSKLFGQQTHIQSHSIQMVAQFLQRQKLSHMTQPMGRCQHQQGQDTLLPDGGQQRVVELKSRLPQKSQLHQIILFMLNGHQSHTQ